MKNIIKNLALLSLGAVLALSSCTTHLEEINTNPNDATTDVTMPTPYLLTKLQWNYAYRLYDEWQHLRQWGVASQHFSQVNYSEEDRYQFRAAVVDAYFYYMYTYNTNAYEIIKLATADETQAAYGDLDMQIATATILKSWSTMMLCQTFGDVPYTEANLGSDNPTPKYDSQIDIFKGVISELTDAANTLASTPEGWTNGDMIYGGDTEKWYKLANSLRLQYAMRLSNYDSAYSKEQAAAAIAAGVFTSNDDNAVFKFTGSDSPNYHPMYESIFIDARDDYTMCQTLANLMKGEDDYRDDYTNIFKGLTDPRFDTYIGSYSVANGYTNGQPYGLDLDVNSTYRNDLATTKTIQYSTTVKAVVFDYDFWSTFMDYANVCFLEAEYNGNDKTAFLAGIQASFDEWAAADDYLSSAYATNCADYLASVEAKFDAASAEEKLEMIITQKYIHNYGHFSQEGWFEYNRTGYPKSIIKPNDVSGEYKGKELIFTALEGNLTDVATRLTYPYTEFTSNGTNVLSAITSVGGDEVTTPLIWQFNY